MFEKIARLALCLILVIMVASCEKPADTSGEDRLSNSFRNEGPELQQHIAVIVTEIRAHEYQDAMNKLALLAATRSLTNKQKQAVDIMVKKLRYDMEEEIFTRQGPTGVTDE